MSITVKFETEECSRCGGSGSYSFNLRDGDKCLKCNRSGLQTSRRGMAARKAYDLVMDGMQKIWSDVKPGDKVQLTIRKNGSLINRWVQVVTADPSEDGERVKVTYLTRSTVDNNLAHLPVRVWDRSVYLAAVERVRGMKGATVTESE